MISTRELVALLHNFGTEVLLEHSVHAANILLVSDTTTIVDLCYNVVESHVRHSILSNEILHQLLFRNIKVRVHPHVCDVPANWAELSPLEDASVEEGQSKDELLVLWGLAKVILETSFAKIVEGSCNASLETSGWLISEFNSALKNGHWERLRRVGREPETVLWMHLTCIRLLLNNFKFGHPRGEQMTVLKADPVASA